MNRIQKIAFIVMAVAAVTPIVLDAISYRRMTRDAESVDVELQREIAADRYAKGIVRARIFSDGYGDRLIDVNEDFEFYRMVYLTEN